MKQREQDEALAFAFLLMGLDRDHTDSGGYRLVRVRVSALEYAIRRAVAFGERRGEERGRRQRRRAK